MTKVVRMLAGSGLAAVLGALLFGFSGAFNAQEAQAESPPNPPARFAGSVLVDGAAPPVGTRIEAKVGNSTCGVTTTFSQGSAQRYTVDVVALDPGATPNCGTGDAVVTFYIGDKKAAQTGSWKNFQLNILDLTYTTPPTPTPSGAGGGPATTPKAPVTGNGGITTGSDTSLWLLIALGAGALAFGVGGAAAARRNR